MITEKKKIILFQVVILLTLIIFIIIPIVVPRIEQKVELLDHDGQLVSYNQEANLTTCEIVMEFTKKVQAGTAVIAFYDANDNFLEEKEIQFEIVPYGFKSPYKDRILTSSNINISGEVESYEIISFNVPAKNWNRYIVPLFIILAIFMFFYFLLSLRNKCKVFDYNNNTIIVFAYFSEHYVKVNGNKVANQKWVSAQPLELEFALEDGANAKVIFDMFNRITLYINGQVYSQTK